MVINSVSLLKDVIDKKIFENIEALQVLDQMTKLVSSTKIPDLSYIILEQFDDIVNKDFFVK